MPRPPRHSVETGLERVHNWDCHSAGRHYGTLRPRKTYRSCVTDPEPPSDHRLDRLRETGRVETGLERVNNWECHSEADKHRERKNTRDARWASGLAITLIIFAVISLLGMELRLSALREAAAPAEAGRSALAADSRRTALAQETERRRIALAQETERRRIALALGAERRRTALVLNSLAALRAEPGGRAAPRSAAEPDHASALLGGIAEAAPGTLGFPTRGAAQLLRPAAELGQCWGFRGDRAAALVRLATAVNVTHVAVTHLGRSRAAPRDFEIEGVTEDQQLHSLGSFTYVLGGADRQEFRAAEAGLAFGRLRFLVTSNHGFESTCVYRLQVYGNAPAGVSSL